MRSILVLALIGLALRAASAVPLATDGVIGHPEVVATFNGPMPTGVTVSHRGRIFVNFPRWGDDVPYTVAEVRNGHTVAYPDAALTRLDRAHPDRCLVSVQSVVVDPRDRLWILDTGTIEMGPVIAGGPKLVCVDLASNRVVKTIAFGPEVALKTSYLNDIRFDLRMGKAGMAFITDSAGNGPNAIVVVDLDSGKAWRRLNGHPSVTAEKGYLPVVEGEPLMRRPPHGPPAMLAMGADGIAISADGRQLYYCPLIGRHLFSVSVGALADPQKSDADVAATVRDLGDKGGASDGLESDAQGRVYVTNYEHNAIMRRQTGGLYETIARDPRMLWPDTLSLAADGWLYFTANQLERQKIFHRGKDLRRPPYALFRVKVDGTPVILK